MKLSVQDANSLSGFVTDWLVMCFLDKSEVSVAPIIHLNIVMHSLVLITKNNVPMWPIILSGNKDTGTKTSVYAIKHVLCLVVTNNNVTKWPVILSGNKVTSTSVHTFKYMLVPCMQSPLMFSAAWLGLYLNWTKLGKSCQVKVTTWLTSRLLGNHKVHWVLRIL